MYPAEAVFVHDTLGMLYLLRQDVTASLVHFTTALEFEPNNADVLYNLSDAYYLNQQYDLSLSSVEKCLAIRPEHNSGKKVTRRISENPGQKSLLRID